MEETNPGKPPPPAIALAELDVRIAEREFRECLKDVRSSRENYERIRERNYPLGVATRKGREAWMLAVQTWIHQAVELQVRVEKVLSLIELGPLGEGRTESARGPLFDELASIIRDDDVPLPAVTRDPGEISFELTERLRRTETKFEDAAELVAAARAATDRAYILYRKGRTKLPAEEVDALRAQWRTSLVTWCTALGKRESAREFALVARHKVEADRKIESMYMQDYTPQDDLLF